MKTLLLRIILLSLGCGGGPPSAPAAPTPPPDASDAAVTAARDAERQRVRANASNTVLTGGLGVTAPAQIGVKTILGS